MAARLTGGHDLVIEFSRDALRLIGEDEQAARHCGIDATRTKLLVFTITSVLMVLALVVGVGSLVALNATVDSYRRYFAGLPPGTAGEIHAYVNLATCYNSLNKREEALTYYEKAFLLSPELATGTFINNEYGFMLVRMGKVLRRPDVTTTEPRGE